MRVLVNITFPHEPFSTMTRDGSIGKRMKRILDELKPEAAYFTDHSGHRGAVLIVDIADSSKVPFIAEPFFLQFQADVEFHACMTPEDLERAGLEELGKTWK
jgi:hypothetical protein